MLTGREVIVAEVLAAWGQLVVLELWQPLFQLHEEPFAGLVAIGIHVQADGRLSDGWLAVWLLADGWRGLAQRR